MIAYQDGIHTVGVGIVIILLCVTTSNITSNIHLSNQPRLLEKWIEEGYQRDANLCGACARPTNLFICLLVCLLQ